MAEAVFDLINLALSKAKEGKYEEALRILREKWAEISRSLEGQEREKFGSLVIATEADILSEINPKESATKYEEALEIQERLLKEGVDDNLANWASIVHNNYGNLLYKQEKCDEAEKHYKRAIELNPKDADLHFNCGLSLYKQKKYDEAEKHYKEALKLNPKDAKAHINYGLLLFEQKRYDEAEKHYKEALKDPNYAAKAHINYGLLLFEQKRCDEAEKHYKEALKLNPDDFSAGVTLYNLALMFLDAQRKVEDELGEMVLHLSKCKLSSKHRAECAARAAYLLKRAAIFSPDIETEFPEYLERLKDKAEPEGGLQFLKLCRALLIRTAMPFEADELMEEARERFRQKGVDIDNKSLIETFKLYHAEVGT